MQARFCSFPAVPHEIISIIRLPVSRPAKIKGSTGSTRPAAKANAAHKLAQGKFVYEAVLPDDVTKFVFGSSTLSTMAQSRLAALAKQLRAENRNVFLEIQGHTDSVGSPNFNYILGLKRAEAVRAFLHTQGVALNRMSTISYGENSRVASNADEQGRAANRRVVIVVLE